VDVILRGGVNLGGRGGSRHGRFLTFLFSKIGRENAFINPWNKLRDERDLFDPI